MATTDFVERAEQASLDNAGAKVSFVVVEHPVAGIGREKAMKKAEKAWPDILKAATKWTPPAVDPKALKQQDAYPAPTFTFKGTTQELNQMFIDKGWSEGIPVVPPTPEKVKAMLKGTTRQPDEVVWIVPPRNGILTVEMVATYAVMAGCKPAYMPVILGILDGLKDPEFNWLAATTTTHPKAVLAMVNGPIAEEIGLASGSGAAGGMYQANTSIGYAVSLITDVVGDSKPQTNDKSVLGWSGNTISTVVAENLEDSPWEPYSLQRGFSKDDNIVSVYCGGTPVNIPDHSSKDPNGVMQTFAEMLWGSYSGPDKGIPAAYDIVLLVAPELAQQISDAGYTKEQFQKWLFENARSPKGTPMVGSADHFSVFVTGGAGRHSQYWPTFNSTGDATAGGIKIVKTVKIEK